MLPVPDISVVPLRFKLHPVMAQRYLPSLARRYLRLGGRNIELPDEPSQAAAELEAALFSLLDVTVPETRWLSDMRPRVLYGQDERFVFSFEFDGWASLGLEFADEFKTTRPGAYRLLREMVRAITLHTPCSVHSMKGMWMWSDDAWWREENEEAPKIEAELTALDEFLDLKAPRTLQALRKWVLHARRYRLPRQKLNDDERKWFLCGLRILELTSCLSRLPHAPREIIQDLVGELVYFEDRLDVDSAFNLYWNSAGPVSEIMDSYANESFGNYGPPFIVFEITRRQDLRLVREAVEIAALLVDFYVEGDRLWNRQRG